MEKLLIIDGSNLLFQMFFGMPSRIFNRNGKPIQGTLGFVGAMLKIIRMVKPSHVVVIFDNQQENARVDIDENYKANRTDYSAVPEEENPFSQLTDICLALAFLGIMYTEADGCEADDIIASYAMRYADQMEIIISSFDSDFFQLISGNVSVLRYRGKDTVICDSSYLKERYGVLPCQYADFKSLTGDAADNIKGAKGVGPKTAAKLLAQFGCLESILSSASGIERDCIRESVIEHSEKLRQNYRLIKLDGKAEAFMEIGELVFEDAGITTTEVLRGIGLR